MVVPTVQLLGLPTVLPRILCAPQRPGKVVNVTHLLTSWTRAMNCFGFYVQTIFFADPMSGVCVCVLHLHRGGIHTIKSTNFKGTIQWVLVSLHLGKHDNLVLEFSITPESPLGPHPSRWQPRISFSVDMLLLDISRSRSRITRGLPRLASSDQCVFKVHPCGA